MNNKNFVGELRRRYDVRRDGSGWVGYQYLAETVLIFVDTTWYYWHIKSQVP